MSLLNFQMDFPGQQGFVRLGHMLSSATLAEVTVAGYLNPYIESEGLVLKDTDVILMVASDGRQLYKPVFGVNNQVTLTLLP